MSKIPQKLRTTIAANIRACREKKFPGRGGGKLCAESFGVSPRQWSPWERGNRTPDESRLQALAEFFGTTVEELRREKLNPAAQAAQYIAGSSDPAHHASPPLSAATVADDGGPVSAGITEYYRALTRLLNQVDYADIGKATVFLNSLADMLGHKKRDSR